MELICKKNRFLSSWDSKIEGNYVNEHTHSFFFMWMFWENMIRDWRIIWEILLKASRINWKNSSLGSDSAAIGNTCKQQNKIIHVYPFLFNWIFVQNNRRILKILWLEWLTGGSNTKLNSKKIYNTKLLYTTMFKKRVVEVCQ
jgi:hypothetical protein